MAGFCAAFVLLTNVLSSVLLAADADHDCRGNDCPTCFEMQSCVASLQLTGSATLPCDGAPIAFSRSFVETAPCARRAPATTLLTLDVRFDE